MHRMRLNTRNVLHNVYRRVKFHRTVHRPTDSSLLLLGSLEQVLNESIEQNLGDHFKSFPVNSFKPVGSQ